VPCQSSPIQNHAAVSTHTLKVAGCFAAPAIPGGTRVTGPRPPRPPPVWSRQLGGYRKRKLPATSV
jgi:hypothetical protein